jgi:hypothetical protein
MSCNKRLHNNEEATKIGADSGDNVNKTRGQYCEKRAAKARLMTTNILLI